MDNDRRRPNMRFMDCDVIIAGGGLVGTTLARALAGAGLTVMLVDPAPRDVRSAPGFDGRSYALAAGSVNLMRSLGLWDRLAAAAQPILEIRIGDGRAGEGPSPLTLTFDHAEVESGPMGHMVEDRHLRPVLLAETEGVTHRRARITAQSPDAAGITVICDDGTALRSRLLIGCDGRETGTGKRAGIARTGWQYGQSALVAAIAHERPHHGIAHQFFMPEGPLAILPLSGNRASIVWTERTSRAAGINGLPDTAYLDILRPRFGDFLGDIRLDGDRFTYPLGLSLANRFTAPRVALAGDAAHAVHPIAGQGLNAGLKDVAALAEVIVDARRRGEEIGTTAVLDRYGQWRHFDAVTLAMATDGFNRLFSNDNPLLRLGRGLGLGAVSRLPSLRRGFIREAAGLTGDRPRLLQGRPL